MQPPEPSRETLSQDPGHLLSGVKGAGCGLVFSAFGAEALSNSCHFSGTWGCSPLVWGLYFLAQVFNLTSR